MCLGPFHDFLPGIERLFPYQSPTASYPAVYDRTRWIRDMIRLCSILLNYERALSAVDYAFQRPLQLRKGLPKDGNGLDKDLGGVGL